MEREKERWRLAEELTNQFIQRKDIYAIQLKDGRYICVKSPMTSGIMYLHLMGQITLGAYVLDPANSTRQVVLDADDAERFEQLKIVGQSLAGQKIPNYLETSRRGGHLRLFFSEPVSGKIARRFGLKLLQDFHLKVELYPKQEMLAEGPGSLVRLPFGIHQLTGKRYGFIQPDGTPLGSLDEQMKLLAYPKAIPLTFVEANQYVPESRITRSRIVVRQRRERGETAWERIKNSLTVYEFVSQYVDLKATGSGYIGLCPFHDDHHPSFGVNLQGNYWNCFAGCGGGSVIDFWMMYQDTDFKTAVSELEGMLFGKTGKSYIP